MTIIDCKKEFIEFYKESCLDQLFTDLSKQDKKNYFYNLKQCAAHDLSWAHCIQHDQAAKITQHVSNEILPECFLSKIAVNSTYKKPDTCYIKHNQIYNDKYYVSGLPFADYAVIYVNNHDIGEISNVLVPLEQFDYDIDSFKPIGMERTFTGTMRFHGQLLQDSQILISKQNSKIFSRENFMALAFPTNCIGLCFGLCSDIEQFILNNKLVDLDHEFKKLKLDLFLYEQVWLSMLDHMIDSPADREYYNYSFMLYNNGKKMLNNLCKFVLDNGTGYFYQVNTNSQRFRDAMIYTSHMHNYQTSTQEFFRHRSNFR